MPDFDAFRRFQCAVFSRRGIASASTAEISKLLNLKIAIPIGIDIVRIGLIASDDHVSQALIAVVGNNPNVFQANRAGKSNRCAGDALDVGGICQFQDPSRGGVVES